VTTHPYAAHLPSPNGYGFRHSFLPWRVSYERFWASEGQNYGTVAQGYHVPFADLDFYAPAGKLYSARFSRLQKKYGDKAWRAHELNLTPVAEAVLRMRQKSGDAVSEPLDPTKVKTRASSDQSAACRVRPKRVASSGGRFEVLGTTKRQRRFGDAKRQIGESLAEFVACIEPVLIGLD